jgi:hypothetical protein
MKWQVHYIIALGGLASKAVTTKVERAAEPTGVLYRAIWGKQ